MAQRSVRAFAGSAALALLATGVGGITAPFLFSHLVRVSWERIDDVVAGGLIALGILVAAWYALSGALVLLCLGVRAVGSGWRRGEELLQRLGAPTLRRVLGAGAGAALVTGSLLGPALADVQDLPEDLTWAGGSNAGAADEQPAQTHTEPDPPTPDPAGAHGPTGSTGEPSTTAPGADDDAAQTYIVEPGDTLWQIAADSLPADASDADIAEAWPRWHSANAGAIGPDPDLIHPGQQLTPP